MTQSVESSGSFPARRRMIPGLHQIISRKREQTWDEAKAEILRRLHERRPHWYSVIRAKLPEHHVEDVYGQASVRITEFVEENDPRSIKDFDGYIARICINCAIDQLRRSDAEAKALVKHGVPPEGMDDDVVADSDGYLFVRKVMAEVLTERQHRAYVLRHVMKLNSPEIGEVLGISHALARKELSKAQKALDREEVKVRLRSLRAERR
ncbi:sigma-70 family RNA polymerase sigma factor [Streptomyces sp. NPDC006654]|uniref:RNA polymerase sigma factor n=1 Tax=Streptomyces sp. NPDC006654 TaxID=3156897 RepID=UPI0033C4528C